MDNVEDDVEEAGGSVRYVYSIGERSGRSSDTARLEGGGKSDDVADDEIAEVVAAVVDAAAEAAAAADRAKLVTLATDIDFFDANCCCCLPIDVDDDAN